jgi:hypothetical protein
MGQDFATALKRLDLHPEVVDEVADALGYYGFSEDGVANDLKDRLNVAFDNIGAIRSATLLEQDPFQKVCDRALSLCHFLRGRTRARAHPRRGPHEPPPGLLEDTHRG